MAQNQNITYGSYLIDKNGSPINSIASLAQAPVDYRMKVKVKADLTNSDTWLAQEAAGSGIAGVFNSVYYGLITYVAEDTEENNGLYVLKPGSGGSAAVDAMEASNWVRISQTDDTISDIDTRLTTVEGQVATNTTALSNKLDKDFVTTYTQGTIGEGTVFAARSDNTASGQNVYITGAQIKNFAASAVSDKGTFATEAALKEAYPTPEDGWTATVLETGTTWVANDGEWTDSGKASGVTSVNGKTGNVVLVAADIDDVYSDTETDAAIKAAIDTTTYESLTTDKKTVLGAINELDTQVTANTSNIASNTSSIQTINSTISGLQSEIALKQNAAIDVTIQGESETTIPDALAALDTAVSAIKTTAEGAAAVDASNVDPDTWRTALSVDSSSEVDSKIDTAITSDTYAGLTTTAKTVQGAINELDGDIGTINTTVSGISGRVDTLETNITTYAKADASNLSPENKTAWKTALGVDNLGSTYQPKVLSAPIIPNVTTVEATLTALNTSVSSNTSNISNLTSRVGAAETDITELQTTVGDSGSGLVKDVAANKAAITALQGTVGNASSGLVKDVADNKSAISTLQGTVGEHTESIATIEETLAEKANTSDVVLKTDIDTAVGASASASDTKVPSTKAVATAIEGIKTSLSNVYTYKGSATYEEIAAKDDAAVGDVWNSTTANGNYPAGTNYAWTGEAWDALGGEVDLSNYYTKGQTDSAISAKVDPISGNVETLQEQVTTITDTTIPGLQTSKANVDASNITAEQVASWKTKLGFITSGDIPQQVQPDWNADSGLGQILNKPNVSGTTDVTIAGSVKIGATGLNAGKISTSNYSVYTIENEGDNNPMSFDNSKITKILCIATNGQSACNYTVGHNSVIEEVIYGGSLLYVYNSLEDDAQIQLNTTAQCTLYCTTVQRDMNSI